VTSARDLPDQAARDAASTRLDASAFIEAGAGTGKSTTLVARILNTLTDPGPLPITSITSIAAITFTDRAGAELRHRLRERIGKRLADTPEESRDRPALEAALRDLDAAPIGTIHSFAQRILRTHALSAGLPLGFAPATGADAVDDQRVRLRAAVEHLQQSLAPDTLARLSDYGLSPFGLLEVLGTLDAHWLRLGDAAFTGSGVDLAGQCALVADTFEDFLARARADCLDPADKLMAALEERIPPVVAMLRRADAAELAAMATTTGAEYVAKVGNVGGKGAWGDGGAKGRRDELRQLVPALQTCLLAPLEEAVRAAFAEAWLVMRRHREERAHRGVVTFDELLSRARDLLRDDPAVRALVHEQFPLVLVDEFQDTDPVQWELIRLVTADPDDVQARPLPGRLVVVGDPKQAIYAFRGADIDTYTDALDEFRGPEHPLGEVFELTTNFRSVGPLIEWVNRVFAAAMSGKPKQVDYRDLDIRHRPVAETPGPTVTVLRDPEQPPNADGTRATGIVESTRLEPLLVAQEIARAVRDGWLITTPQGEDSRAYTRAATFSDIAILYPARTGVPALLDALDDAGVPYRSGDAGLVFARPVVIGLLAALAVVDDPTRELDLWAALKSPLFACTDVDLLEHRLAGGRWRLEREPVTAEGVALTGPVADALATLFTVRNTLQVLQPATVIDQLLARTRIMEALAHVPRGAFDSDCVRMLRAHAQQFEDEGGVGLPDYLVAVADVQSDSTRSSLPEPDVRDDNAVRLMTIHQAKGLEFPIVVLAAMANNMYDPAPAIGVVTPERYEFTLGKGLQSVGYEEWSEADRKPRSLAERVRLHYVACTRARDHLIVSLCGEHGSNARAHSSLLWDAVPREPTDVTGADEVEVEVTLMPNAAVEPLPADWPQQVDRIRAVSRTPHIAAPSGEAATLLGLAPEIPSLSPAAPDLAATLEKSVAADARAARDGRPLGRAVHAALDAVVRMGSAAGEADVQAACTRAARDEGIPSEVGSVVSRVRSALASDLMVEAMAAPRRWTELYLAAPVDSGGVDLVEGFADLVFEGADGLVLVDYKTDEVITPEALEHYVGQLAAYAELIERATGRPVVRRSILHLSPLGAEVREL
jgi:ATP-dependent exoDNAse (exonuclease V) beta subunit